MTELITNLLNASNEQLVQILKDVDAWKWPRSDLNAWVKVLNKFDDLMDQVIREYNVEKLQIEPFSPAKRDLLVEILRFERLLLENSTNRKTFNSYDVSRPYPFTVQYFLTFSIETKQSIIYLRSRYSHFGVEPLASTLTTVFCTACCFARAQHLHQ